MHKTASLLNLIVLVSLLAAACGSQPASMSDLPVFAGATPLDRGQNSLADKVADTMQASAGSQGLTAAIRLYALPAGTTWDNVQAFYNNELASTDWKSEPALSQDNASFKAIGWSRGSGASEQSLLIGYVLPVAGEGAFIIVGLFSE